MDPTSATSAGGRRPTTTSISWGRNWGTRGSNTATTASGVYEPSTTATTASRFSEPSTGGDATSTAAAATAAVAGDTACARH